jgi:hypothetical protein
VLVLSGSLGAAASTSHPCSDLTPEPQLASPLAHVDDGTRHVWISPLVGAHGVQLGKPDEICHFARVDQIADVDSSAHELSLQPLTMARRIV